LGIKAAIATEIKTDEFHLLIDIDNLQVIIISPIRKTCSNLAFVVSLYL
jgi:hypothetical protein